MELKEGHFPRSLKRVQGNHLGLKVEEASRKVNQRYEMEEEAGEIQSEKATPSTIAGFNDGGRGHKPMQAASRSWENPQLARKLKLNYANRVSEQGNRFSLEPPEMSAHLFILAW